MGCGAWVLRGDFGLVRQQCREPIGSAVRGLGLGAAGLGALGGMRSIDVEKAKKSRHECTRHVKC